MLLAAACGVAAAALWHTSVPGGLTGHEADPRAILDAHQLSRARGFERFRSIDALLSKLALLAVLGVYARRGAALVRESAAGRIGTGMLLAMLGFALVWLAQLPFGVAELWWERRHHVASAGYVSVLLGSFLGLGAVFVFIGLAVALVMALAGPLRRLWWVAAVPAFCSLALVQAFLAPYLIPSTHPLTGPGLAADADRYARVLGLGHVAVRVQRVHRFTSQPNAESAGFDGSRSVILWDTLFVHGFTTPDREVILGHELGHLARDHILKDVGWYAIFSLPIALVVALATRRRGGLYEPAAVPVALFAFVALQFAALPLRNVVQRRYESEADYVALQVTHNPPAQRDVMRRLALASLADPRPPAWDYVLLQDHPSFVQRVGMADAFAGRGS